VKRLVDVVLAGIGLLVLAPVLAVVAIVVRKEFGSPVLFRHTRVGKDEVSFDLCKFRTMTNEVDADGQLLSDADRLTRVGSFLRSTSLDELPELVHVLRGEMSLVGPRPLPTTYLERYSTKQRRRHEITPGITGWAQIHGRNATTWDERLGQDIWYLDHRSLRVDLGILASTIGLVLRRGGVNQEGQATMSEFTGE
jgi:sugar transferase EpsL